MRWWLTARRAHTVLPAALLVHVLLLVLLQDATARLPVLLPSGATSVVAALAVPVVVCSGLLRCLDSRLGPAERTGTRPIRLLDVCLVVVTLVAAASAAAAVSALTGSQAALGAGRNTAFLAGCMLSLRPLAGPRAVLFPPAWVMVVALGGYRFGHPYVWTVIARPVSDVYAALATTCAVAAGLATVAGVAREERKNED